jgi:catechol 2,3-dioxygenase-like lactoylglutathione lyase family enzyme
MALTDGINHVATVTTDLDRLAAFYKEAMDVPLVFEGRMPHPPGLRHGFLAVSSTSVIHAVEDPSAGAMFPGEIGHRGPVDHLALNVPDRATLEMVRDRLATRGATDGTITDFGGILSVFYRDPDGMECEVACRQSGSIGAQRHGLPGD